MTENSKSSIFGLYGVLCFLIGLGTYHLVVESIPEIVNKYFTVNQEYLEEECIATLFDGDNAQIICVISESNFK